MCNQNISNSASGNDPNNAVNYKQLYSLDKKYLKPKVNIVSGVAVGYAYMIAMPVLNVAQSNNLLCTVNLSQLNTHNNFNSHIYLII